MPNCQHIIISWASWVSFEGSSNFLYNHYQFSALHRAVGFRRFLLTLSNHLLLWVSSLKRFITNSHWLIWPDFFSSIRIIITSYRLRKMVFEHFPCWSVNVDAFYHLYNVNSREKNQQKESTYIVIVKKIKIICQRFSCNLGNGQKKIQQKESTSQRVIV